MTITSGIVMSHVCSISIQFTQTIPTTYSTFCFTMGFMIQNLQNHELHVKI